MSDFHCLRLQAWGVLGGAIVCSCLLSGSVFAQTDRRPADADTIQVVVPSDGGVLYYGAGRGTALRAPAAAPNTLLQALPVISPESALQTRPAEGLSRLDLMLMEQRLMDALRAQRAPAVRSSGDTQLSQVPSRPIIIIGADGSRTTVAPESAVASLQPSSGAPRAPETLDPQDTVRTPTIAIAPARPVVPVAPRVTSQTVERELFDTGLFRTTRVPFTFAKADILPTASDVLDAVGDVLLRYPRIRVAIHGHTDSVGSEATNLRLSQARAVSVREYLLARFPSLDPLRLTTEGFGESRPIAANATETGRALNRRVEFVLLNPEAAVRETRTENN